MLYDDKNGISIYKRLNITEILNLFTHVFCVLDSHAAVILAV